MPKYNVNVTRSWAYYDSADVVVEAIDRHDAERQAVIFASTSDNDLHWSNPMGDEVTSIDVWETEELGDNDASI